MTGIKSGYVLKCEPIPSLSMLFTLLRPVVYQKPSAARAGPEFARLHARESGSGPGLAPAPAPVVVPLCLLEYESGLEWSSLGQL